MAYFGSLSLSGIDYLLSIAHPRSTSLSALSLPFKNRLLPRCVCLTAFIQISGALAITQAVNPAGHFELIAIKSIGSTHQRRFLCA